MSVTQTTKERLLQAAGEIFAEKGFHNATVAEICEAAGANIAAVNYHFGDKEKLYDQVWRHAFSVTKEAYPIDGGLSETPTLEEVIYRHAWALLHRIFDEGEAGLFPKMLSREMASPTIALEDIARDALFPQGEHLQKFIQPYLGTTGSEETLRMCMHSFICQCAFFNFNRPLRHRILGRNLTEQEIEQLARHIAIFSMGGLTAVKESTSS